MASPNLESLSNVWQHLPQGHEKPLKQAFYTTAANLFLIVAGGASVAVYFILNPFLKPLCWALLCGTFLYPLKRTLTNVLKQWLQGLRHSNTPFVVGVVLLPIKLIDKTSDALSDIFRQHLKVICSILCGLPVLYIIYHFGPVNKIVSILQFVIFLFHEIVGYFSSAWVWTLFIGYLLAVVFYWTPEKTKQMRYFAIPVWVAFILHVATVAGPLRIPLLFCIVAMMIVGFTTEVKVNKKQTSAEESGETSQQTTDPHAVESKLSSTTTTTATTTTKEAPATKPNTLNVGKSSEDTKPTKTESVVEPAPSSLTSQCFIALFWGHMLVRLWMHMWAIILLLLLPFALMIVKIVDTILSRDCAQLGGDGILGEKIQSVKRFCVSWFANRREVLAPRSIRGLGKLASRGDKKIISILEMSVDQATSILMILMLIIGSVLFMGIGAIQIHKESMHLVSMTSNLLNNTVNPEISQWLPNGEDMQNAMDSIAGNAYLYGRDWIASMVHDLVNTETSNNTELELQVIEVWDRLYETWFTKNTTAVSRTTEHSFPDITNMTLMWEFVTQGQMLLNLSAIKGFVQDNIGTFMSVLESLWAVIKGNMNLITSLLTATISMVFGGGTAILNFVISAILFLTTLFYLLAFSGDQYKPLEWFGGMGPGSSQGGGRIGTAVEEAISGVFMASLKMGAFYGLFTWLTHLIFAVNIVFIPSAMAAVFAAIPFVGTYWAAIPAVLELWLAQGQGLLAICLLVVHMLPAYIVDTAIYSEIKVGHPFLTGLAIAGGMYWLGLEGAIIGPILLCCLVVVVNMYGTMMQSDPTTPQGGPGLSARI
ncbi:transmembrane protein 245-like [Gigantopelta aegis]|uniref:transmembrane protein 245-like n=1 Tax=Gigantopelta aegis TaxID=1735272 RepID=UPI001B88AFD7|nr:transmembrane protein 245-like [Gigantopelta aegis]